jgi:hypothetical protein
VGESLPELEINKFGRRRILQNRFWRGILQDRPVMFQDTFFDEAYRFYRRGLFKTGFAGEAYFKTASKGEAHFKTASTGEAHFKTVSTGEAHFKTVSTGEAHFKTASTGEAHFKTASTGKEYLKIMRIYQTRRGHPVASRWGRREEGWIRLANG